ncbi:hypothetical protein MKK75_03330 [Methylobacterium sp. J-030]|uniref:hypothetical protein n=1 Tax=Methylobacterium sp. J-030 TaxID=2836627 RepID=UPI001FBAC834|nr:hypothetical protein [Methylobacterium sp. J-030]MCJ2067849.1 hypothetical protein [Methylobacterium sp. J-030]
MAEAVGEAADRDRGGSGPSVSLLAWSLRVTAVIGLVAVAAAAQLARWNMLDDGPARSLVHSAGRLIPAPADPETTGAIRPAGAAQAARGTRLDPCLIPVPSAAADRLRP